MIHISRVLIFHYRESRKIKICNHVSRETPLRPLLNRGFGRRRNDLKYRDVAPLRIYHLGMSEVVAFSCCRC